MVTIFKIKKVNIENLIILYSNYYIKAEKNLKTIFNWFPAVFLFLKYFWKKHISVVFIFFIVWSLN